MDMQKWSIIHIEAKEKPKEVEERETDQGFEFPTVCRNDHKKSTRFADEVFSQGQIRTSSPVFEQDLLISRSSPEFDTNPLLCCSSPEFETIPGSSYICMSKEEMSLQRHNKRSSTIWSQLKNLIIQRKSGCKEGIVTLNALGTCPKKKEEKSVKKTVEVDMKMVVRKQGTDRAMKSRHEIFYIKTRELKEVERHRTFLPYKLDLLGWSGHS